MRLVSESMSKGISNSLSISYLVVILILIAAIARLLMPGINKLMLYGVIPLLLLWRIHVHPGLFRNKYIKIYSLLIVWLLFVSLNATSYALAMNSMKTIVGGYMLSIIFYSLSSSNKKYSPWIFSAYIIALIGMIYFLYQRGELLAVDIEEERLDNDEVNANDIAYFLFYTTISVTVISWHSPIFRKWIWLGTYVAVAAGALWLALITASRQIIVFVLPFLLLSMGYRYFHGKPLYKYLIPLAVVVVAIGYIYNSYSSSMYEGSFLQRRMEHNLRDDTRAALLKDAINTGIDHPLLGVGPGNFILYSNDGGFSHCSYTELFAVSGVLGFILFTWLVVKFIRDQYLRYRETHDNLFMYLTIVGVAWACYNYLYAFYTSPWLIAFFFLLIGFSDNLFKQYKPIRNALPVYRDLSVWNGRDFSRR